MLNEDQPRFFQTLAAMASAFRQEADEIMLEGYWMGLAGLSLEQFQAGAAKAMRTAKFMPTVAELRECAGVNLELEEKGEVYRKRMERIDRAWAERDARERRYLSEQTTLKLPSFQELMSKVGTMPAEPTKPKALPAPKVYDPNYGESVRGELQRMKEQEQTKAAQ